MGLYLKYYFITKSISSVVYLIAEQSLCFYPVIQTTINALW